MNNYEFIEKLKAAANCKTLYVKGGFGLTLNAKGKQRAIDSYEYNKKRAAKINAMPNDSFGFDCCGSIKGVIWGFSGDPKKTYGGAVYKSNNMPDVTEKGLIDMCSERSKDLNNIMPGEILYMKGHCGVYIGNGRVIESTPSGKDGLQETAISFQKWTEHGKLTPHITYGQPGVSAHIIAKPTLRVGSRGMQVDYLQMNLNALGALLDVDGQFGNLTQRAVMRFQEKYKLQIDGIYGPKSYAKMREVLG